MNWVELRWVGENWVEWSEYKMILRWVERRCVELSGSKLNCAELSSVKFI